MGRPLHPRYCGTGSGNQIKVRAKVAGADEGFGHIVKQVSGSLYLVDIGGVKGRCRLVDKEHGSLADGEMTISVRASGGSVGRIMKLKGRTLLMNSGSTVAWSFDKSSANAVEIEEVDTDFFEPGPEDLENFIPVYRLGQPSAKFLNSNGRLLHGSGNPSDNMLIGTNGEIEIAVATRYYKNTTTFTPVEGVYEVPLTHSQDWTIVFSIGLVNTDSESVADRYDVTASFEMPGGHAFNLRLHEINGQLHFATEDFSTINIIDSNVGPNNSFFQNIQRLNWFTEPGDQYGLTYNDFGSPLGEYTVTFTATRKAGNVDPIVISYKVNATLAA